MVSSPSALLWLTGLDDELPGQSGVVDAVALEPTEFRPLVVNATPFTFASGALTSAAVQVRFTDEGEEGVVLSVTLEFEPRRSWKEFLTTPRLVKHLETRLERQLLDLEAALRGRNRYLTAPPPPEEAARERIATAFQTARPAARAAIVDRLHQAPLAVQSVLRPAEIAAQDALPLAELLEALILGVQHGVLELEWSVLCPQSRTAAEDGRRIHQDGIHCAACGVRFQSGLHDSMELVFRPRTSVRPDRITLQRLMQGRSPQRAGKQRVDLRQSLQFTLEVLPGRYLLESDSGSCILDVGTEHAPVHLVRMQLGTDAPATSARVPPGRQRIEVVNPLTHVVRIAISRRWRPPYALTAATLYDLVSTRGLLPSALLAPECEVFWGAVMVIDAEDSHTRKRVLAVLRALIASDSIVRDGNRIVVAFRELPGVLLAAEQMAARQLLVGVGIGVGIVNRLKGSIQGEAHADALLALAQAGRPQFAVHDGSLDALTPAVEAHGRVISLRDRPGKSALMVFAAVVDGVPELDIEEVPLDGPEREFDELTHVAGCRIVGTLDRGGVGEVYEVEREDGERLAAKVLHPHLTTARFIQLFNKEGYYASQLSHPNIVVTHDWGEEDGRPFLLMERMVGRTLYQEIRTHGAMDVRATARVLSAVLSALEVIHAKGLVHRDIKPHNVFLLDDPEGAPYGTKLLDFGLMRPAGFSRDERFAGTPEFMAPEQVEMGHVDARSDLYAIAALAYFLRTTKPPFKGRTRGEGAMLRMDGVLPEELDSDAMGPLLAIVEQGLRFRSDERFADATSMRQAIDQVLAELGPA